jgi:hypothetical protein
LWFGTSKYTVRNPAYNGAISAGLKKQQGVDLPAKWNNRDVLAADIDDYLSTGQCPHSLGIEMNMYINDVVVADQHEYSVGFYYSLRRVDTPN